MTQRSYKKIKPHLFIILLAIFVLFLKLIFLSHWLEDWDSVQFALALHNFSVVNHQPHPPGYPLYVLMGKIIYFFIRDDLLSLASLSFISSSLSVVFIYKLAKQMFDTKTAILASIMLIFVPIFWIFSQLPLSNIPGFFFYLLIIYEMYKYHSNLKAMLLISFLAGLVLGVRATEFPVIISILGFIVIKNANIKYVSILVSFIIGIIAWFGPVLILTGIGNFHASLSSITGYAADKSSFSNSLFIENILWIRLEKFIYLFKISYTVPLLIISFLSLLWLISKKSLLRNFNYQFLSVWILLYGILFFTLHMFIYYDLGLPQYTLVILPPLIILVSSILSKYNLLLILIYPLLVINLVDKSWAYLQHQSQIIPPTIAPVIYVKNNFNPDHTTLVTTFTYRQFQYYAPQFENYYSAKNAPNRLKDIVIIDYDNLISYIPALKKYKIVEKKEFSNPELIFSRISNTKLYIYIKN